MSTGSDWFDQARRLLDAFVESPASPAPSTGTAESGTTAPRGSECVWCPHCQAAAVLRGERTEVAAALADVLTASAAALRAYAESGTPAETGPPAGSGPPAETDDGPEDEPPAVQRIEIA